MMTWRWTTGTLALALFLFMALFAAAPSNADESVDKATLLGTPTITTPDVEVPPTPSDEKPSTILVDWANVSLQNNRESYLAVDDPGGAAAAPGTAVPVPAPVQPAPAPAEAPASEDAANAPELATYTVQSGDNLFRIAFDHGVTLEALAATNDISDARLISVGQVLKIPNPSQPSAATAEATLASDGTYVVQSGDSPHRIASRFGITVETILELNDITDSDKLTPGQVLVLSVEEMTPAPSTAATAAATSAEAEETMTYTVASGDSSYGIARRFGIRVKTLMDLNDISDPGHLRPGQVLLLSAAATPPSATTPKATAPAKAAAAESTTHVVEQGENPYRVARRFGISVNALMTVNHITDPGNLRVGQQLVIPPPDTTPTPLPAAPIATSLAAPTGEATTYIVQAGDIPYRIARRFGISVHALMTANSITDPGDLQIGQQLVIPPPDTTPTPPAKLPNMAGVVPDNHQFIWPLESRDLSQYYRSGHGGIDIRSPVGSAVVAAATGTVEFAGWNAAGYGYLVVLDHGNDFRTLYAHNSSVKVEVGQRVAQGDLISLSGSTGYSSGPHLHFEIILDYRPINPCSYLPGGC